MKNLSTLMRLPKNCLSLRRFARDESATVIVEAVIVLPLFLWAYIALFVYWDAFRSKNAVQKASYTISDVLSREKDKNGIKMAYITGLAKVMQYLVDEDQTVRMRVTSVNYSDANKRFEVHWSRSPGNTMTPQTTATLQNYAYENPTMTSGVYVVIVEVEVDYVPAFDVGLPLQTFSQFIVTRPRTLPCIAIDNISCPIT